MILFSSFIGLVTPASEADVSPKYVRSMWADDVPLTEEEFGYL